MGRLCGFEKRSSGIDDVEILVLLEVLSYIVNMDGVFSNFFGETPFLCGVGCLYEWEWEV